LADQLATQRQREQAQSGPGDSLRYQSLLNQYEQCLRRFRMQPFSAYAFNDALLHDLP
jgi:hypothetical protein